MSAEMQVPNSSRKYLIPVVSATAFLCFGIANILSGQVYDMFSLLCVFVPIGFINLLSPQPLVYLVVLALVGFGVGKIGVALWQWQKWSVIVIPIILVSNAYGFLAWVFSQVDW